MLCDAAAGVDSKSAGRVAPGNGQMADNNALNITGRGLLAIILSVPTASPFDVLSTLWPAMMM